MSYDILAESLLGRSLDSSSHLAKLAYLGQTGLLKFLVNGIPLTLYHAQGIRRVLVLRLRHRDLIRISRSRLIEQVQPILVAALVTARDHHGLYMVRRPVVHEGHLLRVDRFLLADFARLDRDALGLHMHCPTRGALVTHPGVSLTLATL